MKIYLMFATLFAFSAVSAATPSASAHEAEKIRSLAALKSWLIKNRISSQDRFLISGYMAGLSPGNPANQCALQLKVTSEEPLQFEMDIGSQVVTEDGQFNRRDGDATYVHHFEYRSEANEHYSFQEDSKRSERRGRLNGVVMAGSWMEVADSPGASGSSAWMEHGSATFYVDALGHVAEASVGRLGCIF